jgi:hypothetical protein
VIPVLTKQSSPETEPQFSAETAAVFLRSLFAGQDRGFAVLHTLPDRRSVFFDVSESDWADRASQSAITLRRSQHVYVAVCSQGKRPQHGRGAASTVLSVPGLWADIDVRGPGRKRENLPASEEDAWQIIDSVPIRPTLVVRSGFGLQPYWLFREPFEIANDDDRRRIAGLALTFLRYLQSRASEQGWHVDATADLARVLRLPGTFNRKQDPPVLVTFRTTDGEPRSNVGEWEELLDYEDDQELARTVAHEVGDHNLGADFGLISQGCAWMRHAIEDAATLSEPEWYRAIAVAARCKDGRRLAHEISGNYPGYSAEETDKKLEQACTKSRAPRCSYIAANFDGAGKYCRQCEHAGSINSLVKIGFPKRQAFIPGEAGSEQEPETVQQAIQRFIAHDDLVGVYAIAPHIAALSDAEFAVIKAELLKHFGRALSVADFTRCIKAERDKVRAERARVEVQSRPEWQRELLRTSSGVPKPNLANAIKALSLAPEWSGVLAHDAFALKTIAVREAPIPNCRLRVPWEDDQYRRTADWLQNHEVNVTPGTAYEAVETVSHGNKIHPVREYLDGLEWDGEPRIGSWLADYCYTDHSEYTAAVGEKWLISAVARIMEPGCKVDTCMILEGDQGWRKSSAIRALAEPWFTDELPDLDSKDAVLQIHGVWIVELGELTNLKRSDVDRVKQWMSRSQDRFRPPFGRAVMEAPRQCVFAGSVNPGGNGYLRDETGGRRFWPVELKARVDLDGLKVVRDQLWAEALERYKQGVPWYATSESLQLSMIEEAAIRYEEDPWQQVVLDWCDSLTPRYRYGVGALPIAYSDEHHVAIEDVLIHAVGKDTEHQTQADYNRAARCLISAGWKRRRANVRGEKRKWMYYKPVKP